MTLAVATQDPNSPAETYVRQHMRTILPGRTVGLGLNCSGGPVEGLPFLCLDPISGLGWRKLASLENLIRSGYRAAIPRAHEGRVTAFLQEHDVRVVLAEFGVTGCAFRRLCTRLGIRLVVNFHGHDATVMPRRAEIRYAYRKLARDADSFICGSAHFRQKVVALGFPEERTHVVPCGVEIEEFRASNDRDPRLMLAVGRMTAKKRPDLLIRAFARAHESEPSLRMELIGDGPMLAECKALARSLGLSEQVLFDGARGHDFVKQRMACAGIFVQHSKTAPNGDQESQGISLIEAMAASLPVVTTDHNGFSESVVHGETGLLSPEGDVPAMAANILRIAGDSELRRQYGRNGRARAVQNFDAGKLAGQLRHIVLGDSSPGAC